jgi:hypothetical protein
MLVSQTGARNASPTVVRLLSTFSESQLTGKDPESTLENAPFTNRESFAVENCHWSFD